MVDVTGGQAELLYNPTKLTGITPDGQDQFRYPLPVDTDTRFSFTCTLPRVCRNTVGNDNRRGRF